MKSIPYPFPLHELGGFLHPDPEHQLSRAVIHDGTTYAGNGFIALKVQRGAWLDNDLDPASPGILARFERLPWTELETAQPLPLWEPLSNHKLDLFRYAPISLWLGTRPGPSPVWKVRDHLTYLSHLQAIARLPRCEIYHGKQNPGRPLYFRFSGGIGMIPFNPRLSTFSFSILQPSRDLFTGEVIEPRKPVNVDLKPHFTNWPPPEPQD